MTWHDFFKDFTPATWVAVVSACIAFLSACAAVATSSVHILNYRRDKSDVSVQLRWDHGYVGMKTNQNGRWGTITVTNRGRRVVNITFIGLRFRDEASVNLFADEHYPSLKLLEGEEANIKVPQDDSLKRYAAHWQELRAHATDSLGRNYLSPIVEDPPSWVTGEQPSWIKHFAKQPASTPPDKLLSRPGGAWYKRLPWIRNKPRNY